MTCGWCADLYHDKCKAYVIGPLAQVWWCECDCDKEKEKKYGEQADKEAVSRRESLDDKKPKQKRRKRSTSSAV